MKAGSIVVFKITSGEELIGEVHNTSDDCIEVKNPAVVMMQRTEGGMGVALMPYLPYCDGAVTFYRSAIVAQGEPSQNMVNEYNRIFGVGIVVPPKQSIIAP